MTHKTAIFILQCLFVDISQTQPFTKKTTLFKSYNAMLSADDIQTSPKNTLHDCLHFTNSELIEKNIMHQYIITYTMISKNN